MPKRLNKIWVIYQIYNILNGKYYIGYTYDYANRWKQHCYEAAAGYKQHFARAIALYGKEAFEYQILGICFTEAEAKRLERLWVVSLRAYDSLIGYNMTFGGEGVVANTETKKKMSNNTKNYLKKNPHVLEEFSRRGKLFHESFIQITNDKECRFHPRNEPIPEKWVVGYSETYAKIHSSKISNLTWITNGIENKRISSLAPVPEGYKKGMSITRNFIWITNGIKQTHLYDGKPIPEGWWKGVPEEKVKKTAEALTGRIWITDGITNWNIYPTDSIPIGCWRGFTSSKGKFTWITDGKVAKRHYLGDIIEEGWKLGKPLATKKRSDFTAEYKKKQSDRMKQLIWITNGKENKRIHKDLPIPENWWKGKTMSRSKRNEDLAA